MKHIFSSNCIYSYKHIHRVLKAYDSHLECVEILFQMFIFIITIATTCRLVTYQDMCLWNKYHMLPLHFRKNNMPLFEFGKDDIWKMFYMHILTFNYGISNFHETLLFWWFFMFHLKIHLTFCWNECFFLIKNAMGVGLKNVKGLVNDVTHLLITFKLWTLVFYQYNQYC